MAPRTKACIFLVLTGGPSQLDTWDLKPDAPSDVRGPFRPIRTNVTGIEISEIFPRMARHADKYALIRSVYSEASPVHEEGLRPIDAATAGHIGAARSIATKVYRSVPWSFEQKCRRARDLVEAGVRLVRVDMFDTVFHQATWDSHGARPFSTIRDYKDSVGPAFDAGFSRLLEELSQGGLLESTLVVAMGEFGRTPRINPQGGRDHWTRCRTVVMAGGGIRGGQVYGSSDAMGAEPKDQPVGVDRVLATMRYALGEATDAEPVRELFA
jgi:hypothetical protein